MPTKRSRYFSPPPPPPSTIEQRWPLSSLRTLGTMSFATLKDIYQETSPFHRFLIPQLLIVVTAIELLRPDRTDSLLYVLSGLIKIGLMADCISVVTLHVRGLSASNDFLAFLLCQTPSGNWTICGASTCHISFERQHTLVRQKLSDRKLVCKAHGHRIFLHYAPCYAFHMDCDKHDGGPG